MWWRLQPIVVVAATPCGAEATALCVRGRSPACYHAHCAMLTGEACGVRPGPSRRSEHPTHIGVRRVAARLPRPEPVAPYVLLNQTAEAFSVQQEGVALEP